MNNGNRNERDYLRAVGGTTLAMFILSSSFCVCASDTQEANGLVRKFIESSSKDRDKSDRELRDLGMIAVPALRKVKSEDEKTQNLLRELVVDILAENSQADPEDAQIVRDVAREEGKAKRYSNAERLYGRARKLYDDLKSDAGERKDRIKEQEYREFRDVCEKMKDKANHKATGNSGKNVDLGFVHIGTKHDMSDEWE